MEWDKPCTFCTDTASTWIRLDRGRGEALCLCVRHSAELVEILVDSEQVRCPGCGEAIHLDMQTEEVHL